MPRTAIVLGGGGLTGEAYEAGVLAALEDTIGFDPRSADLIVGTSAGSQVGAGLRFGLAATDLKAFIAGEQLSREGQRMIERIGDVPEPPQSFPRPQLRLPPLRLIGGAVLHPWKSRRAILTALIPTGQIDTAPFEEALRRFTGSEWCTDALWIVGAKLPSCERVVFGRDDGLRCDVARAVAASCCIPGVFAPVTIDGDLYVDGGIHSPTNADLVADEGFDDVIVVSPMSASGTSVRRRRVNPMRLYCRALLGREVRKVRASGGRVRVFQPGVDAQRVMGINALDQSRCAQVTRAAYEETLDRCKRWNLIDSELGLAA
jgi:NTE family protein